MSLGRTRAIGLVGLKGAVVDVEAHLVQGLPSFKIVGLPDASLGEARERVRAALESCGLRIPARRLTLNLSPAAMPKSGSSFDVALAVDVVSTGAMPGRSLAHGTVHIGELGLDGRVNPVRGVLPMVAAAVDAGIQRVVVPAANSREASLIPGAEVVPVRHLAEVLAMYGIEGCHTEELPGIPEPEAYTDAAVPAKDLCDVVGQEQTRLALEVAAAGGHHLLMIRPPGAGKTMLASRLPSILPPLSDEDAVTVTSIHSLCGTFSADEGLMRTTPFEAPHHTASRAAIVGGGSGIPRPGAASRAHCGVLFLDEAPEFPSSVLQTLRQPLESGQIVLHRAVAKAEYPARFQMVMAANPCPCGRSASKCDCGAGVRRRYLARLSGPLIDRIDIRLMVPPVTRAMRMQEPGEPSAVVAERVARARLAQLRRYREHPWSTNATAPGRWLRDRLEKGPAVSRLYGLIDRGEITMRGLDRIVRLAWSLADLAGEDVPRQASIAAATSLRLGGDDAPVW